MDIIQQKSEIPNNFWLHFHLKGEGGEFLDFGLPFPSYHQHTNQGFKIAWELDGYFHTKKGIYYLNDCIARFVVTFKDYEPRRLAYKPLDEANIRTEKIAKHTFKLREISQHLESIKTHKKAPARADSFADSTFWAIKLFCEDEIAQTGFVVYSMLESWALEQFLEYKEQSTIRAKCRSVWNYYEQRDFKLNEYQRKLTDEEYLMTRKENLKAIHEKRTTETEAKILGAITTLEFMQLKLTAVNLAKYTNLNRSTIYDYKHLWKKLS